ncbi:MAG: hypothetical protein L6U99_09945 [Clostridium sp.]|nr:MAG: hypothetical protein L6U99_09945 [Clostridium sp.]
MILYLLIFLAVVNDHDRFKEINNIMVEYKKIIDNAKKIFCMLMLCLAINYKKTN